jgi:hypothetical protein
MSTTNQADAPHANGDDTRAYVCEQLEISRELGRRGREIMREWREESDEIFRQIAEIEAQPALGTDWSKYQR